MNTIIVASTSALTFFGVLGFYWWKDRQAKRKREVEFQRIKNYWKEAWKEINITDCRYGIQIPGQHTIVSFKDNAMNKSEVLTSLAAIEEETAKLRKIINTSEPKEAIIMDPEN